MSSDSETPKENQFLTLLSAQGSEREVSSSLWPTLRLAYTPCTICDVTHQPPAESALTACIKTLTYNSLLIFHEDLFLTRSNHCLKMPNIFS